MPNLFKTLLHRALIACLASSLTQGIPNIIHIVGDDLGFADVSFRNPQSAFTPNIDALAKDGVVFDEFYTFKFCSPSRSMILTGRWTIHNGMYNNNLPLEAPYGVPLNFTMIPARLKQAGYRTAMIGKWHQGFFKEEYTPTRRGFDTYLGYYLGMEDYWTHEMFSRQNNTNIVGVDFHNDTTNVPLTPLKTKKCSYSTYVFGNESLRILDSHDFEKQPLFMYLPFQAVHSPLEAPDEVVARFKYIKHEGRRIHVAVTSIMDEVIGKVVEKLKQKKVYDNTLIVFQADNGGELRNSGCNYPLRGGKFTYYEGGTRIAALVSGGYLPQSARGKNRTGMIHSVDWYPTYLHLANISLTSDDATLDGINQWSFIDGTSSSKRHEIVHNIQQDSKGRFVGALRVGDFKIVVGPAGSPFLAGRNPCHFDDIDSQQGKYHLGVCGGMNDGHAVGEPTPKSYIHNCTVAGPCLFNVVDDMFEDHDLAKSNQAKLQELKSRFDALSKELYPNIVKPADGRAITKMKQEGGYWVPWL